MVTVNLNQYVNLKKGAFSVVPAGFASIEVFLVLISEKQRTKNKYLHIKVKIISSTDKYYLSVYILPIKTSVKLTYPLSLKEMDV